MVISAADGEPEDGHDGGQSAGLPVNPSSWQEHLDDQVDAAKGHAADIGEDVSAAAAAGAEEAFPAAFGHTDRLALGDEERLPWLESADDVELDEPASDNGRLIGFAVLAVLLLLALLGGIYVATHRNAPPAAADGSLIEANKEPYKVAPKDPGGKTFEGTGDASFKVSEGEKPAANLAGSAVPAPAAKPAPSAGAPVASAPAATSGVGVQIGAFSTNAGAEAAWSKLSAVHAPLAGLTHRVIEGKADMATVFRLQAVAGDVASANALCGKLSAGGLKCQVKR
jgi:hypothetical protein